MSIYCHILICKSINIHVNAPKHMIMILLTHSLINFWTDIIYATKVKVHSWLIFYSNLSFCFIFNSILIENILCKENSDNFEFVEEVTNGRCIVVHKGSFIMLGLMWNFRGFKWLSKYVSDELDAVVVYWLIIVKI